MERKLAAILAADVVGYSKMMEKDEAGTLAALNAHRKILFDPETEKRGGRIVKLMGDGVLVEFPSVVDAVECAIAIQQSLAEDDGAIKLRIGINLGDVIIEGDDIYGEGVNLAARLEELAVSGSICVAHNVYDQVKNKVEARFEDLGERKIKNISEPIHVFGILPGAQAGTHSTTMAIRSKRPIAQLILGGLAVILLLIGGIALWQQPREPSEEPATEANMAFALPEKPSIAVLPFNDMSKDADQEYFADGITDDLITDLSKVSGLFVIARNSTFVYKGAPVKIRKVAEDLGVRYVLEGSVRRIDDQIRVNAQLIDATTGGHVWADRFDGNATKVFEVQDDFIRQIVGALKIKLTNTEETEITAGRTDQIEAREAFQKGWERYIQFSRGENAKAVSHFERAISLDPEYGRAYAALALVYLRGCKWDWLEELNLACLEAEFLAKKYIALAEQYPTSLAHIAKSFLSLSEGQHQNAFLEASSALKADPNDPDAYLALGWSMILTGRASDGQVYVEQAMRLNPTYPGHYSLALGIAYFAQGDPKNAAAVMEDGLKRNPGAVELSAPLASMYGRLGERKKGRRALLLWRPTADESVVVNLSETYYFPYKWHMDQSHIGRSLLDGLRVAAMPLQTTLASWIDSAGSGNFFHRLRAIKSIGYFGPLAAEAVPILIKTLSEKKQTMRIEAVVALEKIGPGAKDAVAALEELKKTDVSISDQVDAALNAILK